MRKRGISLFIFSVFSIAGVVLASCETVPSGTSGSTGSVTSSSTSSTNTGSSSSSSSLSSSISSSSSSLSSAVSSTGSPVIGTNTNTVGMTFYKLTNGVYIMGDPTHMVSIYYISLPHQVTLSGFSLSKYETTYQQWKEVYIWATNNGYTFDNAGACGYSPLGDTNLNPVTTITWNDAVKWCNALSDKEGKTPCYYTDGAQTIIYKTGQVTLDNSMVKMSANGYRLPTEAEWEYACRAGSTNNGTANDYYWGHDSAVATNYAWFNSLLTTHETGLKLPNNWGFYDMAGNVYEYCWDWFASYTTNAVTDPMGDNTGSYRISRGGCFYTGLDTIASGRRTYGDPFTAPNGYLQGFRIAVSQ